MFLRAHIALLVRISGWHRARMGTGAGTLCSPHRLSMSATLHMHVQAKRVIFHGSACLHSSLSLGSMWKKKPSSTTSIYNRLPLLRPLHQVCQFITNFCGAMWHVCHVANFDSSFDRGSHILPHQCWSPKCSSRRLIDCWFFAASLACVCFQRPSTPLPAPQPLPDGYYACTWVNWQPMYTNVELWCWQVLVL